ncbi:hypothetical protein SLS62_004495 [Diatrype stigma]|uniref:Glycoside hydrolase family 92 protein n=1 Tax=Diatrype stigma TaxID=117547 RepID=A0AAN9UUW0_9PEZI
MDVLSYIDPLIGTVNGGHVFPGASLPYGMAKAVADVKNHAENAAGFVSDDSDIIGFSHLHDSGTGGSSSLGNFPLFPHPGCPEDDVAQCKFTANLRSVPRTEDSVTARPGYFAIGLENSVYTEMTTTARTALYRFNFPTDSEVESKGYTVPNSPLILVDLSDLASTQSGGYVEVYPDSGRIVGNGTFRPSFGTGQYQAHFCADFQGADIRKTGTFTSNQVSETTKKVNTASGSSSYAGGWVQFSSSSNNQIMARVGISFISIDQACANAEQEIPEFGFEEVVQASEEAWREKLSVVQVDPTGMNEDLLKIFWSGLYRAMLSPEDYTGENPLWESAEPYFDSFYCIWDSFRAQHPLLTIVDPETQTRMVRTLIDVYKHEGKLPDCRMSFSKGYTQGGSNADVVLADAFVKNLTEGIDWNLGYEAVVSDAEVEPPDWTVEGRGNVESWHKLGYIPSDDKKTVGNGPKTRTVSRTVEYAYDDFAIALMARGLRRTDDEAKYFERSKNWKNLWNPEQGDQYEDEGDGSTIGSKFRGFLQPRLLNGSFAYQNPRLCSPIYEQHRCYFDTGYDTYEGSPWLYTFYVPQDMAALIATLGGREAFVERLEYLHASGILYMGNEQSFLPTFQFHYAGRPARSAYWVRQYIPAQFNSSLNGIPGNDDSAMGSFTTLAFLGFFPVAGQDVYLLVPPLFREVSLRTPTGRSATIRNVGAQGRDQHDGDGGGAIYIQSARLNGQPYTRNWITHDFFYSGGVLEFVLGAEESGWGTRDEDLPPSLSTTGFL